MDLLVINQMLNAVWYIFTIVFILYKFTTFFSHAYNFIKFCGKLISGGKYLCGLCFNYFQQKQSHQNHEYTQQVIDDADNENINETSSLLGEKENSIFDTVQNYATNVYHNAYYKVFGKLHPRSKANYVELPLYNSQTPDINPIQNINKNVINSFSKNHDYSSLTNSNVNYNYSNNSQSNSSFNSNYFRNSNMLYTIPLNESYENYQKIKNTPKTKPFGINDSDILFNSSFINTNLNKRNLPFAVHSFYTKSTLDPLTEENNNEEHSDWHSHSNNENHYNENNTNNQNKHEHEDDNNYEDKENVSQTVLESHYEDCN